MNYAGKFDGAISSDGLGSHSHFVHLNPGHVHAPADAIVVPDAHFLFNADFKRSGVDLILSGDDRELVLHGYFKGEKHKALASPDGAHLTGDLVNALTGHVEIAQAGGGTAAASSVIGHVTKLAGSATVIRNGVSIILNMGDNVEKGDVVQSGSNSTVGITFIDGTVFGLSSNAKMVLNDMVYETNGSNNSSLMSLVAGTITFVAGETAKHGDMKIDTPVATMGIRGTAVLVEIDFSVPGANGAPNASFQVLVEPDGTTGSYILFDKNTLQPLAIVNQAGQQININNGIISQTQNPLTPEMKALVSDVFQKFFSNTDTNTKTASTTGSSTPDGPTATTKVADSSTLPTTTQGTNTGQTNKSDSGSGQNNGQGITHVPGAPIVTAQTAFFVTEISGKINAADLDQIDFKVGFTDVNVGDHPTAQADFTSFTYKDVHGADVTASLSALQRADIAATETALTLTPDPGNTNNGFVGVLYSLADKNFDFLAAGEELTLTYTITVNTNYGPDPEATNVQVTFTIIGTNDQPIITTDNQLIHFAAGTGTSGGSLVSPDTTGGTFDFTDVDLTDTHWITDPNGNPNVHVQKAVLTNASMGTLDLAGLEALAPGPMSVFEQALDVDVSTDSTGTGNGKITWQLENLPVFLADFIPAGETLKLFYTIEVTDEQGATDTKIVEVDITGTNAAATVWIHTTTDGHDGNWTTGANWGTGNVPTDVNDVIIVTDQLHPNTPAYPATITTGTQAAAHSVVMNDFVAAPGQNIPPELKLETGSSLTIGTDFDLSADSRLTNDGTINVNGKLELLDDATNPVTTVNKSVITNSGTINLAQGGDIQGLASVTNSGTIELQGGTLNLDVNVANSAGVTGGNINVDSGAKLVLGTDANTAAPGAITGGTVSIKSGGELDLTGQMLNTGTLGKGTLTNMGQVNVSGTGNSLDQEIVSNTGNSSAIDITGALVVINGTAITDTDTNSGETVEGTGTLTLKDTSSISGGQVTNKGTLNLHGTTASLSGGKLTNTGSVNVSGSNNSLTGEQVLNTGTASAIDITGTLTAQTGTTIANQDATSGETIESGGKLTLADTSSVTGGQVTNKGTLNLQGTTASLSSGKLTNTGQVNVSGSNNSLTGEQVLNTGTASAIDITGALTAQTGTTIANQDATSGETVESGGTLTLNHAMIFNGTINVRSGGELDLTGAGVLNGGNLGNAGAIKASSNGNALVGETVTNTGNIGISGALTLSGTTVTGGTVSNNTGSEFDLAGGVLTNGQLGNSGQINVSGSGNALVGETVTANNWLEVLGGGALTIDSGSTVANTGTIRLNGGAAGIGALTVNDATIDGGSVLNSGTIKLTGGGVLKNGSLQNSNSILVSGLGNALDNETVTVGGVLEILAGGALTIDQGSTVFFPNSLEVDGTLTLNHATITTGVVDNDPGGDIELTGSAVLKNGWLYDFGQVNVSGTVNALHNESVTVGTKLEVLAGGDLTIDQTTDVILSGNITVDSGGKLTVNTATIHGAGTVTDNGDIELTGGAVLSGGTLANNATLNVTGTGNSLHDESVSNAGAGAIDITGDLTLDLGSSITNGTGNGGSNAETIESGASLTLDDTASISGGKVVDKATLTLNGTASLSNGILTNTAQVNAAGTNSLNNENVTNTGTIEAINGGTLKLSGLTVTNTVTDAQSVVHNGAVSTDGTSHLDLADVTIDGGTVTVAGTLTSTGSNFINGATVNFGLVDVTSGTLTIDAASTLNDNGNGLFKADGGNLVIDTGLSGHIEITGASTVELGAAESAYSNVIVTFDSGSIGTLVLDQATTGNNGPTVAGLDDNNLDFRNVAYGSNLTVVYSGDASGGTLSLYQGGQDVADINLTGDYLGVHWVLGDDGTSHHGTTLSEAPGAISGLDSNGNAVEDQQITVSSITDGGQAISGATYQWQLDGQNIQNAAGASYIPTENDEGHHLTVNLTFVDALGNTEHSTVSAGTVQESPTENASISLSGLTNGNAVQGQQVTATVTEADAPLSGITYTWTVNGVTVKTGVDAAGNTYIPAVNDDGLAISVAISFIDAHGFAETGSTSAGIVQQPLANGDHPPVIAAADLGQTATLTEVAGQTGVTTADTSTPAGGTIHFTDVDLTDRPTASVTAQTATYLAADGSTPLTLTAGQLAAIEHGFTISAEAGNTNNGAVDWSYSIADNAIDFLAAGQTVKLVSTVTVGDGHGGTAATPVTITITGTDDAPVIAAADLGQTATLAEVAGQTGVTTADASTPAGGTIHFTDVDLTDRPTASVTAQTATYLAADGSTPLTLTAGQLAAIEHGFTISAEAGNTNNGAVDWSYSIADNAIDFLAAGQTVKLVSTVTVGDGHGGTAATPVTITITGTDDAPVIAAADLGQTATLTEVAGQTGVTTADASTPAGGTIHFTDVDLTDRPTASVTAQTATYLAADGSTPLTLTAGQLAAIEHGFTISAEAGNTNNGAVDWSYSIGDNAIDFLAAGQTVKLVSTVTVGDGHGGTAATPVTITITGTDDAPVITSGAQTRAITELANTTGSTTPPDMASGTVTFTDADLSDTHTVTVTGVTTTGAASGLPINATLLTWLTLGTLTDSTNGVTGSDDWSFSAQDKNFDYLAVGQQVTLTYTVQADDHHGGVVTTPVIVTVTGTDDAPVITSGAQTGTIIKLANTTGSTTPDTASGTVTFTDPDLSDTHAVTITGVQTSGATAGLPSNATLLTWLTLGTLTDSTNGVTGSDGWSFSAQDKSFDYLAAGQQVTLTYTVQVDDHNGGVVTTPVTVTINGADDAPVITSGAQSGAITEVANTTGSTTPPDTASGTVTFTDPDLSDTHAVTITGVQTSGATAGLPSNTTLLTWLTLGTLTDSTNGVTGSDGWSFSAQDKSFDYLAAGQQVMLTYTVQVDDHHGGVVTTPVTITINGADDAPVITSGAQSGGITELANTTGSTTPPDTASGTVTFTDPDLSDTHAVTITGVQTSGATLGLPTNATLLTWLTLGTLTDSTNGVTGSDGWNFSAQDKSFDYLAAGQQVTLTYTVQVDDHHGGVVTTPVTITITGTDDAPVITSGAQSGAITEVANTTGSTTPPDTASGTVTFTDADLSDTHTVTVTGVTTTGVASGLPTNATLLTWLTLGTLTDSTNGVTGSDGWSFSAQDKSFDYLAAGQQVTLTYGIQIADNHGGTTTTSVAVIITGTNDAPAITFAPSGGGSTIATNENTPVAVNGLSVSDVDGGSSIENITLSISNGSISFDGQTGASVAVSDTIANINTALANGVTYTPGSNYSGPDDLHLSINDQAPNGAALTTTQDIAIAVAPVFGINQGPQTASVADGGAWNATGQFTVSGDTTGDTWSIAGGSKYATGSYNFGIDEFSVVKTVNGTPNTSIFDDSFNGTVPPAGPAIQNASSPSGVSYSDFNSGTYVQGSGEALIESSHDGYVGTALGVNSYGDPVFGQFTTLLTGTSYNAAPGDGLRSGQSFTVSGTFDLNLPTDTTSRYGIRLSDRVSAATNPADNQPGTEVVDLGVIRTVNSVTGVVSAGVILSELNYETGVSDNLQVATINVQPEDNEIRLSLTNDAANNGVVVASYTLFKSDGAGGEVADGTFTLGAVGHIFDNEDWTRAQFYGFDTSTTTSSLPQADSILQGTYGQLDLAQDGTWHYSLNPGLPTVKALAAGVTAQDTFNVMVTNAAGQQSTQTITVNVTGVNDAPVVTAPAQYSVAAGTSFNLVNTGLSVNDADGGNGIETATLSVSEGNITIAAGNSGATVVSATNGTGSVTFSGTIAQINALLNSSTGTVVYNDNAAPPSSQATLTLTVDDNGSNGGSALSGSATTTVNLAPSGGAPDWNHEVDPFAAPTQASATLPTKWVIPNTDGLTSTVFNGGGFTYDATTHLPTGGGIASIQLVDNTTGDNTAGHVLETITNVGLQLGDLGNFIAREEAIRAKVPWAGLIETGDNGPLSFSGTKILLANSDGTVTEIIGNNFMQLGESQLTGTVTAVQLLDASNVVRQSVSFSGGTSLGDLASAVFSDNSSRQFYNLMAQGNTNITGNATQSGAPTSFNFTLDDAPGNHTFTGAPQTFYTVNFGDATSGVTVNLGNGTASWGGFHDILTNISNVFGSKFGDTIVGNANGGFLDGDGAQAGTNDTLTGSVGTTFVFQQGYGALTITNFDQANGTFDATENDQILLLNGLTGPQNVTFSNGNTVLGFGSGDVITLQNVTQAQYQALNGSEFSTGGNNGGNGGNISGPVISNANNTVTYTGTPVFLDQSVTVSDTNTAATVSSVNVWISSGSHSGDTFSIDGAGDGTLVYGDGTIQYHFGATNLGQPSIFLSAFTGTPSSADFDQALQLIQFSPGAADGNRTVTWAAYDNVVHSPTVTTTVNVGPILNSFTLVVTPGGTTVLTNNDFNVSDPGFTNLTYSVNNVTGGQFEVFQNGSFQPAPTGGFTTAQIAEGQVEFVQDGTSTVPNFTIHVSDPNNASPDIAPTVLFNAQPWGELVIPKPDLHLFNAITNVDPAANTGAVIFGTSPSNGFNPAGPDSVTEKVGLFDPFVLPYRSGSQTVQSSSTELPFKYNVIMPVVSTGPGTTAPEAIAFYSTQTNGVSTIYQDIISEPSGPNGSLTVGAPTVLQSNLTGAVTSLFDGYTNFNASDVSTSAMTSYSVAWAVYDGSNYQAQFQIFPSGGGPTAVGTIESLSNLAAATLAPAWQFRNAGALSDHGISVPYASVLAVADGTHAGQQDVQFQGYNVDGTANPDVHFLITPDLTHFQPGATNQISQPSTGTSLLFTPNGVQGSGFSVAWSEAVIDSNGTHSQVEFAMFFGSGQSISHTTFQVPDAQNIRVGSANIGGVSVEYLAYGDATSTTVVEFDASGNQLATIVDREHHSTFSDLAVMGDGRIALTYSDGSQYTSDIFDLRTTGVNINASGYVAGTHFNDSVTGGNNVNNFYYFVGQDTLTSAPTDHFNGGTGTAWNEAIFADFAFELYREHDEWRHDGHQYRSAACPCRTADRRPERPGAGVRPDPRSRSESRRFGRGHRRHAADPEPIRQSRSNRRWRHARVRRRSLRAGHLQCFHGHAEAR